MRATCETNSEVWNYSGEKLFNSLPTQKLGATSIEGVAIASEVSGELSRSRQLTEIHRLLANMQPDGSVPQEVLDDTLLNLETFTKEGGLPSSVSTTFHKVEQRKDDPKSSVIMWAGKTAVQNAMSGFEYHFSEPAFQRVEVEVDEAAYDQQALMAGKALVMISPKMSRRDAPADIAKAEHLHDDDAIRVSYPITNSTGAVVMRKMQSLLIADVPLSAYVNMLTNPNNPFGKSVTVPDPESALSVMKVFRELTTDAANLPEGPVTIVAAVIPYIKDPVARASAAQQLTRFRARQGEYDKEASYQAKDWLTFEHEQAKSLKFGRATAPIRQFIISMQHHWNKSDLAVIWRHDMGNGNYRMSDELAAVLEQAKQYLVCSDAAVNMGEQRIIGQMPSAVVSAIKQNRQFMSILQAGGVNQAEINRLQAEHNRLLADSNAKPGGGCAGTIANPYGTDKPNDNADPQGKNDSNNEESKGTWRWQRGICRIDSCPSHPGETEVGPCGVCHHCQNIFDMGGDPTKYAPHKPTSQKTADKFDAYMADLKSAVTRPKNAAKTVNFSAKA